jgi:hypothetical protein
VTPAELGKVIMDKLGDPLSIEKINGLLRGAIVLEYFPRDR